MSLRRFAPRGSPGDPPWTLLCFPHAGAGATAFAPWRRILPPEVDLYVHVPPGREERIGEPPLRSVEELAAEAVAGARDLGTPLVIVGHSFGSWVAYEVAQELVASGEPPARLVVLAAPAPGFVDLPRIDDDRDIEEIWVSLGADVGRLSDRRYRELVLPALRADLHAQVTYQPPRRPALPLPVTVLYGDEDPSMAVDDAATWQHLCGTTCAVASVAGGHFFPQVNRDATVARITRLLGLNGSPPQRS